MNLLSQARGDGRLLKREKVEVHQRVWSLKCQPAGIGMPIVMHMMKSVTRSPDMKSAAWARAFCAMLRHRSSSPRAHSSLSASSEASSKKIISSSGKCSSNPEARAVAGSRPFPRYCALRSMHRGRLPGYSGSSLPSPDESKHSTHLLRSIRSCCGHVGCRRSPA